MRYVKHDGCVWLVDSVTDIDGDLGYVLVRRGFGGKVLARIVARAVECEAYTPDRKRRIKADGITLTFNVARGIVIIRKGRAKGYELTLLGLYHACVRQAAVKLAQEKAFRKRTRRGK